MTYNGKDVTNSWKWVGYTYVAYISWHVIGQFVFGEVTNTNKRYKQLIKTNRDNAHMVVRDEIKL